MDILFEKGEIIPWFMGKCSDNKNCDRRIIFYSLK